MFEIKDNDDYKKVYAAFQAGGARELTNFTGQVSSGSGIIYVKGDRIEWPSDDFKPLEIPMRNAKPGTKAPQALIVKVVSQDGSTRYQPFFPSSLGKSIMEIEVDDKDAYVKSKDYIRPRGAAALDYQAGANFGVDEVFNKIRKKGDIVISEATPVWTFAYDSNTPKKTYLYTFDYAQQNS